MLGLSHTPHVHLLPDSRPRIYLLTVPEAWAEGSGSSRGGGSGSGGRRFSWRRHGLMVVTQGAVQGLSPGELQAALGCALLPLCLPGGCGRVRAWKLPGPCARAEREQTFHAMCDTTRDPKTQRAPLPLTPGQHTGGTGWDPQLITAADALHQGRRTPCLADVATLAALAALVPSALSAALPPQMRAMAGAASRGQLAVLLTAAAQLVGLGSDRGALLVAQGLPTAVSAIVATSITDAAGDVGARRAAVAAWMERVVEVAGLSVSDLLPSSSSEDAPTGGVSADAVLLLRLRELVAWEAAGGYAALVAEHAA